MCETSIGNLKPNYDLVQTIIFDFLYNENDTNQAVHTFLQSPPSPTVTLVDVATDDGSGASADIFGQR